MMDTNATRLRHDETSILSFRPQFRTMIKAQFISTTVWSLLFLAFYIVVFIFGDGKQLFPFLAELSETQLFGYGVLAALVIFVGLLIYVAFHMWIFGEIGGWDQLQHEEWVLSDQALHLFHPDDTHEGNVPLHAILSAHKHFLFSIRLRLENKQSIVLRYLEDRNSVLKHITTTMQKAQQP